MDSEFLIDNSLSDENMGGSSYHPFYLTFEKLFPFYLSIGMTYEQYWDMDCTLVAYYREAEKLRQKRFNYEAWWQGVYIYEALCNVSPIFNPYAKKGTKPIPYPHKPYDITEEDIEKSKEEKQKEIHNKGLERLMMMTKRKEVKDE